MKRTILLIAAALFAPALFAQFGPPPAAGPPKPAKEAAPIDLTGYWVSVITEDWRWRMVTPLKGDAASVPTSPAARPVIDSWDPAKDEAAGLQCKAYGAAGIMRLPGRVHITWQDDNTLKIETDAGQQTRLFYFGAQAPKPGAPSWQGYSAAKWEAPAPTGAPFIPFILGPRAAGKPRSLEVTTTGLRAGYLRKNGVPYSDKTTVKEYYDLFTEPNGDTWFMVTTVVDDPVYLAVPFVTTSNFKKIPDASGWDPTPCSAR